MDISLSYVGAWLTIMAGVWLLFEKADETIKPTAKQALAQWLGKPKPIRFLSHFSVVFA